MCIRDRGWTTREGEFSAGADGRATRDGENKIRAGCSDDASAAEGEARARTVHDQPLIVQRERARGTVHSLFVDGRRGRVVEAVSGRRHAVNCGQARTKPDRIHAACAPGARREHWRAQTGERAERHVHACVRTMSRSASVLPSPVAPLGPHMHHMAGRVAESPGRANRGSFSIQDRTFQGRNRRRPPDGLSGLRSPATGGA